MSEQPQEPLQTPLPPDIFADYDAEPPRADKGEPDDAGVECGGAA